MSTQLTEALDKLKSNGVRMTPQRHAILAYLLEAYTHPTADDIYKALESKFPNMSVATVYNNLKVFIESGLVRELTYGDDSSRFDADMSDHYHAQCVSCGKIVDFDYPPLSAAEKAAGEQTHFQVQGHRLEVYGTCPDCARAKVH
jgi:Fur family transcriptional regulator, peroxide stress response regulator